MLLPLVNAQKDQFNAQGITNLLWAMAKLVDNGQAQTPGLKEAVAALLPHVKAQKDQFNAQGITNLLWAIAKLVDNRHELIPRFKEAVAALLPHVNAKKKPIYSSAYRQSAVGHGKTCGQRAGTDTRTQ